MHNAEFYFKQTVNGPELDYEAFLDWVEELTDTGRTSGPNQTAALVGYTALNLTRMRRISKTIKLDETLKESLKAMEQAQRWLVITEAWCGDSAQNLPILAAMSNASEGKIELSIILRDENTDIMDRYLTNGGRSIPKLIAFHRDDASELFTWGPRPTEAQQIFLNWKADPKGKSWPDFETDLHTWYARNKGRDVQNEFADLLLHAD